MARGGLADALASLLAHSIVIQRGATALDPQPCYVSPASGQDGPGSAGVAGGAAGAAGEARVTIYGAVDFDIRRGDLFVLTGPSGEANTYQVENVTPALQIPDRETGAMGPVAVKASAKVQQ